MNNEVGFKQMFTSQTLLEMLNQGKNIWVKNNSMPACRICLLFSNPGSPDMSLDIPAQAYPICLNQRVPENYMVNSGDLRDYLNKGILILMEEEEALKELKDPIIAARANKNQISPFSRNQPSAEAIALENARLQQNLQENTVEAPVQQVNPRLIGAINKLDNQEEEVDVNSFLFDMRALERELDSNDIQFLISKVVKPEHKPILSWAEGVFRNLDPVNYQSYEAARASMSH